MVRGKQGLSPSDSRLDLAEDKTPNVRSRLLKILPFSPINSVDGAERLFF